MINISEYYPNQNGKSDYHVEGQRMANNLRAKVATVHRSIIQYGARIQLITIYTWTMQEEETLTIRRVYNSEDNERTLNKENVSFRTLTGPPRYRADEEVRGKRRAKEREGDKESGKWLGVARLALNGFRRSNCKLNAGNRSSPTSKRETQISIVEQFN